MGRLITTLDRVGGIAKRPPIWAVVAAGLVAGGGRRGRDAALRGGVAYGVAAVLANVVVKPAVHRKRPPGSEQARIGPLTSSFPSGHAATDLAFVFGVSQRVPALFPPLAACTLAAHWSLVRTRAHYLTDILAGGALGIAVALAVGAVWPKGEGEPSSSVNADGGKEVDDRRLLTRIDGEEARLLVHIEPLDERQ
jgi:membrane-associated phospholipid phosphatase